MPRVLIVEDDPGIGRLLGALLHFEGYEIEDAKDWDDILFAVEQIRPDLAIMDVHLRTGMMGLTCCARSALTPTRLSRARRC